MTRVLLLSVFCIALTGCSAEAIQREFDDFLEDNRSCATPDDCTVIFPGCPLGCFEVVSSDAAQQARDRAAALIRRYEAPGRSCDYDCIETPPVDCVAQTCVFVE